MGGGPYLVAFFTDSVFHDEKMMKNLLLVLFMVGGAAAILFYALALKPYQDEMIKQNSKK